MSQIRINRTSQIEEVLSFLRNKYRVLSEAEIIKVALAEKYSRETNLPLLDEELENVIANALKDYNNGRYTQIRTDEELDTYLASL